MSNLILNNISHETCPLCRSDRINYIGMLNYSPNIYFSTNEISLEYKPELWICKNCESQFIQNTIPFEISMNLYSQGLSSKRWSQVPFVQDKSKEVIKLLREIFHKNNKVLDIGCNTGELLDFAKSNGCKTYGVEPSESSRKISEEKKHICFSSILDINETFDVITAFDLVEHLNDVPFFLDFCRSKLTKNGSLIIQTGDISSLSARLTESKWWYLQYPEHIIFPSKKFYKLFSGLNIRNWIPTYASVGYRKSILKIIAGFIFYKLVNKYNGLPSLGQDHVLIVLTKSQDFEKY